MSEQSPLTLDVLKQAVAGNAVAFRCVTQYQPAGESGDKVFPPTYEGGKYATEKRVLDGGEIVDCVLLDSVQSQANRMELVLLDAWEAGKIELPVISVEFKEGAKAKVKDDSYEILKAIRVTTLEAPHRIADAIFRDSMDDKGRRFRQTEAGQVLNTADIRNAVGLFRHCPTALVFGLWDSTGPRGGLGAKFQRAMVSEMVGVGAQAGVKTSSRIEPLGVQKSAGPVFRTPDGAWTLDETRAAVEKGKPVKVGKDGNPSEINQGNVTPDIDYRKDRNRNLVKDENGRPIPIGGFTIARAVQTTVISLPALRRLRFPLDGRTKSKPEVDEAARTMLAATALLSATLLREQGADLRSRCLLVATEEFGWDLLDRPGKEKRFFTLDSEQAVQIYRAALSEAKRMKLPWHDKELTLTPSPELLALVAKSQHLAAATGAEAEAE